MIIVGIGSNLPATGFASPQQTVLVALRQFATIGVAVVRHSRWYLSEPVPPSGQPWYVNGAAIVSTRLTPPALLHALLSLEHRFGRRRGVPNAARTLDLDLLDYDGRAFATRQLVLPHPRLHARRFVLAPLAEIAPQWRHPRIGLTAARLLALLPPGQPVYRLGRPYTVSSALTPGSSRPSSHSRKAPPAVDT